MIFKRVPPCGASYFAHGGKVGKTPPGISSEERLRAAGAPSRLIPGPLFTREGHFGPAVSFGGLSFDRTSLYSRATGPFCHQNLKSFPLYRTPPGACLPVGCGGGRAADSAPDSGPAATVLPEQAVSVQRRHFLISDPAGPCEPGQGGCKVLCSEPPDEISYFPGGRPLVKRGSGGKRL